jgi:hypothetical protein
VILAKVHVTTPTGAEWGIIPVLMLIGFLIGTFGGEAGVNLIGGMIRARQDE